MTITQLPPARPPAECAIPARDLAAAETAAAEMLTALGVDLGEESRTATPGRMVRALAEVLTSDTWTTQ
ncbi:hypothetical protein SAMN05216275_11996 [Streptosporangium canum]|uniref:Uncharacterized protein n=1 Tax=Streptosporangium canum TaxID=324952 RepID=A0A1I3XLR8_9ACTN|nr:hypothetical protein [Streptosporangium canum]SFK19976.1 hypothetical protein SAMN05216275_11996 [Streptosporangium canum]